jgi:hypothetical protein
MGDDASAHSKRLCGGAQMTKPQKATRAAGSAATEVSAEERAAEMAKLAEVEKIEAAVEPVEPMSIAKPASSGLDAFKSKRAPTIAGVETLLAALPLSAMSEAKDWVRLHPDAENYWSQELCFVGVPIKGDPKDQLHLIAEDLAMQHLPSGRIQRFRLALASKPDDRFFLCRPRAGSRRASTITRSSFRKTPIVHSR